MTTSVTVYLAPAPINVTQFIPGGNTPANGAQLFAYAAGSSNKQNTYTTSSGSVAWSNPIILDSGGNLTGSKEVWLAAGQTYDFVLAPSTDQDPPVSPYWTVHSITGINDTTITSTEWIGLGSTATFVNASTFTISGDATGTLTPQRRLKTVNTGGTLYSTVTSSIFSTSTTTIGIRNDTTGIDAGINSVSYSIISTKNDSLPYFASVTRFGAKGDGVTDDSTAIQNAINSVITGQVYFPRGRYLISSASLSINKNGVSLVGEAPAGQLATGTGSIVELLGGGTINLILRYGDPAEASPSSSHLYPGGELRNLTFTGTANMTSGVRIYNATVHIKNTYVTNVMSTGGLGIYMKNAWLSTIKDTIVQSNSSTDIFLDTACNSVSLENGSCLSNSSSNGIHIVGGSNTINIGPWDFEGKNNGLNIDTSGSSLQNLNLRSLNFESNTSTGINQSTTTNPVIGFSYMGGRHNAAGSGINLLNIASGFMTGVDMIGPNISLSATAASSDIFFGKINLSGGSTVTGNSDQIYTSPGANSNITITPTGSGNLFLATGPKFFMGTDAPFVLTSQTITGGASTATFTNSPHAGTPIAWPRISINGSTLCFPCFQTT